MASLATSVLVMPGNAYQFSREKFVSEDKALVTRSFSGVKCSSSSDHGCGGPSFRKESRILQRRGGVEVRATEPAQSPSNPSTTKSILCKQCEGNGAVPCSQCKGSGINDVDHFGGQFKAGTICWLCRGKRETLCGNCNGAGFMGGYLNALED